MSIVEYPTSSNLADELLDVGQIIEQLALRFGLTTTYTKMRGLLASDDVRGALGAVKGAGKGVRYPSSSLPVFARMVEAHNAGTETPATILSFLTQIVEPIAGKPISSNLPAGQNAALSSWDNAVITEATSDIVTALNTLAAEMAEANRLKRIEAPDDELLTAEEAGAILRCKPRTVRSWVAPVKRGRWRRSDVMKYIAGLGKGKTE